MKKIESVLISVFHKQGLDEVTALLKDSSIKVYSTGGTYNYLSEKGVDVIKVEDVTAFPEILDGRVKTLHPKVFGGILARREEGHLAQLKHHDVPTIDMVVVDLYPFEETVKSTQDHSKIIEKIDIGGIALIRAAAKNFNDVVIIPSQDHYSNLETIIRNQASTLEQRSILAGKAFNISSQYDDQIQAYLTSSSPKNLTGSSKTQLRYGENPHQEGVFYGDLNEVFTKLSGKDLSFNNIVDIDAAISLMAEFEQENPTFAILKHTNVCGLATRINILEAWKDALIGDPISAFGGVFIANTEIDLATAQEINKLFYEVIIAPSFSPEALELLTSKKKRVLLQLHKYYKSDNQVKSVLNGVIQQDYDRATESKAELRSVTKVTPTDSELEDLVFANKLVKHLKSNTIVLARNGQLLGMGCGQTSRVDACNQAIDKARRMGLDLHGAVMASDAFFPFPDCVELAHNAGIKAVIQPGGSIKDTLSIDYCDAQSMSMVFTGVRHFKH